jgi:16S rRNA (guanine527-N7)-methyltransferase
VISRADMTHFYIRHALHSLGIAKVLRFKPKSSVLDVGTGGGFPGIPLAIMFPETQFTLVDSVGKKIKVVQAVAESLALDNVKAYHKRAEDVSGTFDFVVSRAVTRMDRFVPWVRHKINPKSTHALSNGILYLKGGDLNEELSPYPKAKIYDLDGHFKENFFETKKVVHLPL